MEAPIVNRVSESGLITLDLGMFLPGEAPLAFDLAEHLFMGMILREKDFRDAMAGWAWGGYMDRYVAVHCSADAIIPSWAYMLVASRLSGIARDVYQGTPAEMEKYLVMRSIDAMDLRPYVDHRVVVKGCGDRETGAYAFLEVTRKLRPVVRSLMYGEPCSTVPVYKRSAPL